MNWTEEEVSQLIELVRRRPCLYDEQHEEFNNEDVKQGVILELVEIIASTRPDVSVDEVTNKWEEIKTKFFQTHLRTKRRKKRGSSLLTYYDKMKFMLNHVPGENQSDISENGQNEEEAIKKASGNDSKHLKIAVSRYSPDTRKPQESVNGVDKDSERNKLSTSAATVSAPSESSPENTSRFGSPLFRQKRARSGKTPYSTNSNIREISYFSMTSPHMMVDDSILDRTEPYVNENDSFSQNDNGSVNCSESYSKEDEDTLYVKYLLCKLKKLDPASKLRFKVEIEKMFYENMTG